MIRQLLWLKLLSLVLLTSSRLSEAGTDSNFVEQAKVDLATRLGVAVAEVTLIESSETTWPDRSLGCPKPDTAYPQVITDGSRLILTVGKKRYFYHAREGYAYFYCSNPVIAGKKKGPIRDPDI